MTGATRHACAQTEHVAEYAFDALNTRERSAFEAHLGGCSECREELAGLRPVIDKFLDWPTDVLRPPAGLWTRLVERIGAESEGIASRNLEARHELEARWSEPEWREVAHG